MIDLQRPRERRYTHEDQQIDHPGDMGFEYVSQLQELNLAWGKATATVPSSAGGGGPVGAHPNPAAGVRCEKARGLAGAAGTVPGRRSRSKKGVGDV
jgi:hypothetical protein